MLALFLAIAYAGIRVAVRTKDPFIRYMAAGITIWLTAQMMINVGMVLALLPVIGLPLPLVSYGGSALLPSLVALGLLVSFARAEPGAKAALGPAVAVGPPPASPPEVSRGAGDERCCWPVEAPRGTPPRCWPPPMRCAVSTAPSRSPRSAPHAASRAAWCPRPATRSS